MLFFIFSIYSNILDNNLTDENVLNLYSEGLKEEIKKGNLKNVK